MTVPYCDWGHSEVFYRCAVMEAYVTRITADKTIDSCQFDPTLKMSQSVR